MTVRAWITQPWQWLLSVRGHEAHALVVAGGIIIAVLDLIADVVDLVFDDGEPLTGLDWIRLGESLTASAYLVLVLLRPRWAPLVLATACLLMSLDPEPGGMIPFMYLSLAFAAYTSSGRTVIVSVLITVAWAVAWVPLTSNLPVEALWGYVPVTVAFVIPGLALQSLSERFAAERQRRLHAERAAASARAHERKELARELHDIVAHELTIIAMQARAGALTHDLDIAHEALQVIGDSSRSGLEEMRRLIAVMRADGGSETPGEPGTGPASGAEIPAALERAKARLDGIGIPTSTAVTGDLTRIPAGLKATLVSVLREGTTNVAKHAGRHASCVITVTVGRADVALSIRNTLPGHHLSFPISGYGLVGVRERVSVLGGELVSQREAQEWLLSVRIPLRDTGARPGPVAQVMHQTKG